MVLLRRLLVLLLPLSAFAEGPVVGPDCTMTWAPGSGYTQGYRLYVDNALALETQGTTATCSTLNIPDGQHTAYVVAYNPAGESAPSNSVPFVLVTVAPGSPVLRVE